MSASYQVQLYTLHRREPHDFRVVRATTLFTELRQAVARLYAPQETAQALFARHFFVLVALAKPRTKNKQAKAEEKNKTMQPTVLDEAQLYMNDDQLAAQQLLAKHLGKQRTLVVFPSPAHLVRSTLRPPLQTRKESHFTVEIYAPHRHGELRARYEAVHLEEAKYTRRSDGTLEARRFVDRLTMPGRGEHDPHMDITFIALARDTGAMIGYCESTLVLQPYGREAELERASKPFLKGVAPGNLFDIAGLSALPSQGGHQIALVLLYHAFHFAWQHRALLPCSHAVSHAASIVTKTYLTREFGFAYTGANLFDNDDAPDTLPPRLAVMTRDTLRTCAMHLRDALRYCALSVAQHTGLSVTLYQLMLWFKFVNSKGLELLLVLQANAPSAYVEGLVRRHLQLQSDPRSLQAWLRDDRFYSAQWGLKSPQYGPLKQTEHEIKVPAEFGLDEVMRVLVEVRALGCATELASVLEQQFTQLRTAIEADAALVENYALPGDHMKRIGALLHPDGGGDPFSAQDARIDRYVDEQTRLFMELYAVDLMDTHLVFSRLGDTIQRVAEQYARGETKNFITPVIQQAQQGGEKTPTKYPDDLLLLRVLLQQQAARIEGSQQFDDAQDEYYHNLRLRYAFLSDSLNDYVIVATKARSDQ